MSQYELPNESAFAERVIEASHQIPVLVDFWAEWCGPCRMIGPILEKLANEEAAKPQPAWQLVKVNTELYPAIAQAYRIQGIPNMKLFVDGAVSGELAGALPEPQMRAWLQEQLPSPAKEVLQEGQALLAQWREGRINGAADAFAHGPGESVAPVYGAEAMDDAAELAERAKAKLEEALAAGMDEARADLAELALYKRPEEAMKLLEHAGLDERSEALRTLAGFLTEPAEARPDGPASASFTEALEAFARRTPEQALEAGIRAVSLDKNWHHEAPRRLVVALFQLLGQQHPLVLEHRRAFSMALY